MRPSFGGRGRREGEVGACAHQSGAGRGRAGGGGTHAPSLGGLGRREGEGVRVRTPIGDGESGRGRYACALPGGGWAGGREKVCACAHQSGTGRGRAGGGGTHAPFLRGGRERVCACAHQSGTGRGRAGGGGTHAPFLRGGRERVCACARAVPRMRLGGCGGAEGRGVFSPVRSRPWRRRRRRWRRWRRVRRGRRGGVPRGEGWASWAPDAWPPPSRGASSSQATPLLREYLIGKVEAGNVLASAPSDGNLCHFRKLGCRTTHSNTEVLMSCSLIFFATKPHILPSVLAEVFSAVTEEHILVSLAAGVSLQILEELLPPNSRVLRIMPNLPCMVQEGAVVIARGSRVKNEEAELLRELLSACGLCEEVPESYINIHTGLSGSGVAYVCMFSEALAEGAIKMGMPSALAHRIAAQTLMGAGKLLLESGKHPAQLRTDVCTPGGTTIYGLHALEQGGLRAATMSAVEAATGRARELGKR
uniref:Pyrroline-5-carboxylate reductase n=1 Tax=Ornithorhynchus anatinus TaxID=9258 RepID=A0A6I8NCG4_ORNAN